MGDHGRCGDRGGGDRDDHGPCGDWEGGDTGGDWARASE